MMKAYSILLCWLITLCSCHKNDEHWRTEMVDSSLKDSFHFGLGSFWVYREDNTVELDCVYVVQTSIPYIAINYGTSCAECDGNNYVGYYMIKDSMEGGQVLKSICLASNRLHINFTPQGYLSGYVYRDGEFIGGMYIDTLRIDSTIFYTDIFKLKRKISSGGNVGPYDTLNYYLKKNVGIVRKEIKTHTGEIRQQNLIMYEIH